jgi:hypothetical protein
MALDAFFLTGDASAPEVLFADAGYTDADISTEVAVPSVGRR